MVLLFPLIAFSGDFRKVNWGATEAEVKKTETAKFLGKKYEEIAGILLETAFYLVYEGKVSREDSIIIYHFSDGKLVEGEYRIEASAFDVKESGPKWAYYTTYLILKEDLEAKYGKPVSDWSDKSFIPEKAWAEWETKKTKIKLEFYYSLSRSSSALTYNRQTKKLTVNYTPLTLTYTSKAYLEYLEKMPLEPRKITEEDLEGL